MPSGMIWSGFLEGEWGQPSPITAAPDPCTPLSPDHRPGGKDLGANSQNFTGLISSEVQIHGVVFSLGTRRGGVDETLKTLPAEGKWFFQPEIPPLPRSVPGGGLRTW